MAFEVGILDHTFTMNVSSTAKQYYLVKHTTSAETVTLTTAAGERALGVIQDKSSSGGAAQVRLMGISKVAHDGTLAPNTLFQCSTAGLATQATTEVGVYRLGLCLEAVSTASGTLATVFLWHHGQSTN